MCAENAPGTDSRRDRYGRFPAPTALDTALWLLDRGLWPILISPVDDRRSTSPGKTPIGRAWGRKRPTRRSLRAAFGRYPRAGVGLVLGPRGRVVDLEIDDPERATAWLRRLFPAGLSGTLGWRSQRGEHRLFAWDDRLLKVARASVVHLAEGAIELRMGGRGKQVSSVCPPSPASDGRRRTWNGIWWIAPLPDVLVTELRRMARPRTPRRSLVPSDAAGIKRYAAAALEHEVERVRSAEPGSRNCTLNRAAFCLGQLVAGGLLSRQAVEAALGAAASECGLDEREAAGTIRSGLEAGLARPRSPKVRSRHTFG